MARVILSENKQGFLSEQGYTAAYLSANKAPNPALLHGFLDNLIDGIGDFGSGLIDIGVGVVDAAGNIIGGVSTGVTGYVSNPNNIAQIGGTIATSLTGMPIGLTNQQQQMQYQQQTQDPLQMLMQNPLLLIGAGALIYLIAKK